MRRAVSFLRVFHSRQHLPPQQLTIQSASSPAANSTHWLSNLFLLCDSNSFFLYTVAFGIIALLLQSEHAAHGIYIFVKELDSHYILIQPSYRIVGRQPAVSELVAAVYAFVRLNALATTILFHMFRMARTFAFVHVSCF
jgi:hypothetical protein